MKIKKDTIIRTAVLTLALANQILVSAGHDIIPISDEQINEMITLGFTVGASLWAWWKNNSFTKNAIKADETLKAMKEGDK